MNVSAILVNKRNWILRSMVYVGQLSSVKMEDQNFETGTVSFYCISGLQAFVFNSIMLGVIYHQKELQDYMRVLHQCLGACNLILGINWSLWSIFWFSYKTRKVCTIISMVFPLIYHIAFWSIMACLCGISLNLYLLVTKPLRYHTIVTRKRFFVLLASTLAVIILAGGIYLPIPNSPFVNLLIHNCIRTRVGTWKNRMWIVHTLYSIFPVCATMVFTTTIHIRLMIIARQKRKAVANVTILHDFPDVHANNVTDNRDNHRHVLFRYLVAVKNNSFRKKRVLPKGIITIILPTGSFCVLWTPRVLSYVTIINTPMIDRVASSNTWVQPILYLITNAEVRKMCFKYIRRNPTETTLV